MTATGQYKLVQLQNGSWSVHSLREKETFHPVIGPVAEAEALYVHQLRLLDRVRGHRGEFVVWDVGLGAAANVLTVLQHTKDLACRLRVLSFDHSLEPLRFAWQNANQLGYLSPYGGLVESLLAVRSAVCKKGPRQVHWDYYHGDFPALIHAPESGGWAKPNAILFDAFSPARNPTMWTLPLFSQIFRLLDPRVPCAMPTYSRSTMLRVSLLLAGFFVGAGKATGEKEETTIASNSLSLIEAPLDRRWLMRARRSTSAEPMVEPVYRQLPLTTATWERLQAHPQFA